MQMFFSLIAIFLMSSSIIFKIPFLSKFLGFFRLLILIVLAILFILPIPYVARGSVLTILHGLIGNLSIISFILFLSYIINGIFETRIVLLDRISAFIILIAGLLLYTSYLGLINYDLYKLGYFSNYFLVICMIIAFIIFFINKLMAWSILVSCVAFYFQLQASNNIWDYLIDPILFIIAIYTLLFKKQKIVRDDLIYNH